MHSVFMTVSMLYSSSNTTPKIEKINYYERLFDVLNFKLMLAGKKFANRSRRAKTDGGEKQGQSLPSWMGTTPSAPKSNCHSQVQLCPYAHLHMDQCGKARMEQ